MLDKTLKIFDSREIHQIGKWFNSFSMEVIMMLKYSVKIMGELKKRRIVLKGDVVLFDKRLLAGLITSQGFIIIYHPSSF